MDREVKVRVIRGNASSFYNNNKYLLKCYKRKIRSSQMITCVWLHVSLGEGLRKFLMNLIKKKDSVDEDINISSHSETMSYFVEETLNATVLDSGCTGNVCGKMWLKCKYLYLLMPSGKFNPLMPVTTRH